jgi:hypothetical protein
MTAREVALSVEELLAAGWTRRSIADEPRLSEVIETYEELGLEVCVTPVPLAELECNECYRIAPERVRLVFTRPRRGGEGGR